MANKQLFYSSLFLGFLHLLLILLYRVLLLIDGTYIFTIDMPYRIWLARAAVSTFLLAKSNLTNTPAHIILSCTHFTMIRSFRDQRQLI